MNVRAALLLLVLVSGAAHAQTLPPSTEALPRRLTEAESEAARATAPFQMFSAWLDAFNAPEVARLREFGVQFCSGCANDVILRVRDRGGVLDLRALEESTPTSVTGVLQSRDSEIFWRFTMVFDPAESGRVKKFPFNRIPRPADFPLPRLTEKEIFAALDTRLADFSAADKFAGVVLITKHRKAVYSAVHGLADREKGVPNNLGTRFNLGSMNKMFTATAIMQLVQAGKVHLSDALGKYVPDYPNEDMAKKVTIEQLLTHTGGTGNIFGPDFYAHRLDLRIHDDYVKLYGDRGPTFEPGSRFDYSNYGPVLLGVVIERVTRQNYFDYVARQVYRPAGMKHTGSDPMEALLPNTAIGYMRAPEGGRRPNTDMHSYRGTAGGGGYSNARDLAHFADALLANKLLSAANTRLLIGGKVERSDGGKYAFGFDDKREDGKGYVGHGGAAPGVSSMLMIYPGSGYVVVVLANVDPPIALDIGNFVGLRLDNQRGGADR